MTEVAEKRKYHNPSPIWVGVNVFDAEGKRTSIQVEPGGYVWMSAEEAQMTAEAPVKPENNPFVATWDRVTGTDHNTGEQIKVTETGLLVLTDDPPRPIGSERFIPGQEQVTHDSPAAEEPGGSVGEPQPSEKPPHTGAAPTPSAPPEQGERAEDEVVATPEAVAANDAAKEAREGPTAAPTPAPRAPISGA